MFKTPCTNTTADGPPRSIRVTTPTRKSISTSACCACSRAPRTAISTKSTAVTRYPRRASAIAFVPVPHPISRTVFPGNNPASRTRTNSALGIPESHGVSPVRYDFSNSPPPIGSPPAFKTSIDGCLLSAEGGRRLDRFDLAAVVRDVALDHVALQQQPVKGIED